MAGYTRLNDVNGAKWITAALVVVVSGVTWGCVDSVVSGADNSFNVVEVVGDESDDNLESPDDGRDYDAGEPCDWGEDHPWSSDGAGAHNTFRSSAGGPSELSDVEYLEMPLQTWESADSETSPHAIRSIAVAASGMSLALFRSRDGDSSENPFVLKAFDASGDALWDRQLAELEGDVSNRFNRGISMTLVEDCQIAVAFDDGLYFIDGADGSLKSDIEFDGPVVGPLHVVDSRTMLVATDRYSGDFSDLKISVQSIDDDRQSSTTIYEGFQYSFWSGRSGSPTTVYDETTDLLFVPASGAEIDDPKEEPEHVSSEAGIVGIDRQTGQIEMSVLPHSDDLSDGHSAFTSGFGSVYPVASDGDYLYFHADSHRTRYLGAVDLQSEAVSWFGYTETFADTDSGTPTFQGAPGHVITGNSSMVFAYLDHIVAVDDAGETAWKDVIDDSFLGAAGEPAMVADATGSIYIVDESSNEILRLSESGNITDRYAFDDRWARVRPIAMGAEQRLMLEATDHHCHDDHCTASTYLVSLGAGLRE